MKPQTIMSMVMFMFIPLRITKRTGDEQSASALCMFEIYHTTTRDKEPDFLSYLGVDIINVPNQLLTGVSIFTLFRSVSSAYTCPDSTFPTKSFQFISIQFNLPHFNSLLIQFNSVQFTSFHHFNPTSPTPKASRILNIVPIPPQPFSSLRAPRISQVGYSTYIP